MPIRTLRSTHRLSSGHVCATVVDEHLRLVRVVVPFGMSGADDLHAIIDATLDARKPGTHEWEQRYGR